MPTPTKKLSINQEEAGGDEQGTAQRLIELTCSKLKSVDAIESETILDELLADSKKRVLNVAFLNAHAANIAAVDTSFYKALNSVDVLFRDGAGASILCRTVGIDPGYNMNGSDLIPRILQKAGSSQRKVILFGTRQPFLEIARDNLREDGIEVVMMLEGFNEPDFYLEQLRRNRVESPVIILGMGMPKQELLALQIADLLESGLIISGGAIIDRLAGEISRGPDIMRRLNVEWLYRLLKEPRRLFRRYVVGNFIFMARLPVIYINNVLFRDHSG